MNKCSNLPPSLGLGNRLAPPASMAPFDPAVEWELTLAGSSAGRAESPSAPPCESYSAGVWGGWKECGAEGGGGGGGGP